MEAFLSRILLLQEKASYEQSVFLRPYYGRQLTHILTYFFIIESEEKRTQKNV